MHNLIRKKRFISNVEALLLIYDLAQIFDELFIFFQKDTNENILLGYNSYSRNEIRVDIRKYTRYLIINDKKSNVVGFINHILNEYKKYNYNLIFFDWDGLLINEVDRNFNTILQDSINFILSQISSITKQEAAKFITDILKISFGLTNRESDLFFNIVNDILSNSKGAVNFDSIIKNIKNIILRTPFENELRYSIISKLNNLNYDLIKDIYINAKNNNKDFIYLPIDSTLRFEFKLLLLYLTLYYINMLNNKCSLFILNIPYDIIYKLYKEFYNIYILFLNIFENNDICVYLIFNNISIELDFMKKIDVILISNNIYHKIYDLLIKILGNPINQKLKYFNLDNDKDEYILILDLKYIYRCILYIKDRIKYNNDEIILS